MARLALLAVAVILVGCIETEGPPPPSPGVPGGPFPDDAMSVLATGLDTVWSLAFAPDGRIFFTERAGTVSYLDPSTGEVVTWATVPAAEEGEGGLMGLALDPAFPEEPFVYLDHTFRDGTTFDNRIVRLTERDRRGVDAEVLLAGIPAAGIHDGGRIAFGPDGKLYATTGDASVPPTAQADVSLAGKVLRLERDGSVPEDNPNAGSYVFTRGHRNPQGLAFHPDTGAPYATEHGPDNHDEVNVLEAGSNYGWPIVGGRQPSPIYEAAIWSSGPDGTIAPAGAAFVDAPGSTLDGAFVFATLKGQHLHVLKLDAESPARVVAEHRILEDEFGRIRAATWHEGALYIGTSNNDGRGSPGPDDDRIMRVPIGVLEEMVAKVE